MSSEHKKLWVPLKEIYGSFDECTKKHNDAVPVIDPSAYQALEQKLAAAVAGLKRLKMMPGNLINWHDHLKFECERTFALINAVAKKSESK